MGPVASKELLIARWTELVNDPSLHDLPYKIELNQEGKIEISPASNRHGMIQGELAHALRTALPSGAVITECSILTELGVRVPDVVWASQGFLEIHQDNTPYTHAPEMCIEIVSPSNTNQEIDAKIKACLAAGALEAWAVSTTGEARIFGAEGEREKSAFGVEFQFPATFRKR